LTDKEALLLLSLTRWFKAWVVFAVGSVAFTITSAIIVTLGRFLISYVPVSWVSVAGGTIMICYGLWSLFHAKTDEEEMTGMEMKLSAKATNGMTSVFLSAVGLLLLLDLAGDATEVLTILFVTRFGDTMHAQNLVNLVIAGSSP
jgi:putative Ca2+/H+ antiporter (TMEM165/GDT1 family)